MNEVYYYSATAPFLCGKLPTGFKIRTKIHLQPKGSIDCIQATQLPALGLPGELPGARLSTGSFKKVLLSSTSAAFHPHFPVHVPFS